MFIILIDAQMYYCTDSTDYNNKLLIVTIIIIYELLFFA
jgi:hypothetical protein